MAILTSPSNNDSALKARVKRSVKKLITAAVAFALLVNAGLGFWLYNSLVLDSQTEHLQQVTAEHAKQQAAVVARVSGKLKHTLKSLSQQALLQQAMTANDREQLRVLSRIQESRKEILSLRFFPLGTAAVDRQHAYPIRFAELNMLHRAEKNEPVKTEAAKNDDQWQLFSTMAIANDAGKVLGTGLVVSKISTITSALASDNSELGRSELVQSFNPSHSNIIASSGSGSDELTSSTATVDDSHWQLRFTASPTLAAQVATSPLLTIIITVLSTIICIATGVIVARHVGQNQLHRQLRNTLTNRVIKQRHAPRAKGNNNLPKTPHQNQDVLNVTVAADDEDILGLGDNPSKSSIVTKSSTKDAIHVPAKIFRSYDIRGLAETEINTELANKIGRALGSEALDHGESSMVVARDARNSSPELCSALIEGIKSSGCDVINIGIVPSPLMYFATHHLNSTNSGVMVTASHNPAEYNGFKMVINGVTLADDAVMEVRSRILRSQYHSGQGTESEQDLMPEYIDRILADVALAGDVHIVIDAGNGATSEAGPLMFKELGCEVTPLHCEFDGNFPNHQPDPSRSENLQGLIAKVLEVGADLGVAFDGDGDRLTIVTATGRIIWPDQLLMLFARDIVSTNPGTDVLFDVKSTRLLNQVISSSGGRPIMWKTGHSHMKAKMIETGALLGGEFSGHIFIKHRWYGFDDGIYACARLLEIITLQDQSLDEMIDVFPKQVATEEIRVPVSDARKFSLVKDLIANGNFQEGERTTIDGLRVDFGKGWGLVRASNTSSALTLRFEADTEKTLQDLQALFKRELLKIEANIELNF
jgi:phosphomannomutase/phosphoglucomutase